jgi:hypothetical protein
VSLEPSQIPALASYIAAAVAGLALVSYICGWAASQGWYRSKLEYLKRVLHITGGRD